MAGTTGVQPASLGQGRKEPGDSPRELLTTPGAMGQENGRRLSMAGLPFPLLQVGAEGATPGPAAVLPAPSSQPPDP